MCVLGHERQRCEGLRGVPPWRQALERVVESGGYRPRSTAPGYPSGADAAEAPSPTVSSEGRSVAARSLAM